MTTETRRIDPDPVIDELLGRRHFDKRLPRLMLQAARDHQRSLIIVAAVFAVGVAVGLGIGTNGTSKSVKSSQDE